jgi:hypothetical protein
MDTGMRLPHVRRLSLNPALDDSRPTDHVEPDLRKPAAERVAIWEDFVDIFHNPSAVFARREHGSVFVPMIIITVAITLLYLANRGVLEPLMAAEARRAMPARNAQVSADVAARMDQVSGIFGVIGVFVFTPIGIALTGLLVWIVGRIVGSTQSLHAAMIVATYAYIPMILGAVVVSAHALFVDPAQLRGIYDVMLSAGRLVDPATASPFVRASLGRVDVFIIWQTVLLAIGLAVTGRISRNRALVAGFLIWLIPTLLGLLGPLITESMK